MMTPLKVDKYPNSTIPFTNDQGIPSKINSKDTVGFMDFPLRCQIAGVYATKLFNEDNQAC